MASDEFNLDDWDISLNLDDPVFLELERSLDEIDLDMDFSELDAALENMSFDSPEFKQLEEELLSLHFDFDDQFMEDDI